MTMRSQQATGPIDVAAFEAANARAYLAAVFSAWEAGETVAVLPASLRDRDVPGLGITRRESFDADPGWFEGRLAPRDPEADALVAFSSGTTGQPKAILLPHRALDDVVTRINTAMGVDATIREYLGVPVTFSFGFGRARAVADAGGAAFLPDHGFDPAEIGRMLAAGEINAVSAVPTLWRVLLANSETIPAGAAKHLRWIEIGSQWMTGAEKLALRRLFPEARIVQHYGLTEASRSALLDISEVDEARLDSVGRATGDVRIDIDGEGRIRVAGPHVARGLVTEAGVTPVTDADGWLTTSDRGRLEDGWLYYEGRVDELVNVGGIKIDPTAYEQKLNARLGVPGAAAAGRLADPLRGEKLLIALRHDAGIDHDTAMAAAEEIAESHGLKGRGGIELREVADLPLTATGKVRRADLPGLAAIKSDAPAVPADRDTAPDDASTEGLRRLWADILGVQDVPVDKGFYDLGGDSLSALTAVLRMEAAGIDPDVARGIFDGRTIAELSGGSVATHQDAPRLSFSDAINAIHATRGVLVLWVVLIHWLPAALVRIDPALLGVYEALTPAWRLGTPGFAIVFGMGIGALRITHYAENREMFRRSLRLSTALVVGGVLALGAVKFAIVVAEGRLGDRLPMSGIFYSVITYYALALLALPWIVALLWKGPSRLLTILVVGVVAFAIDDVLDAAIAWRSPPAFWEFLKIVLTAKYGFFQMTGYVMIGAAIGWVFRQWHTLPDILSRTVLWGVVIGGFGFVSLIDAGDLTRPFALELRHVAIYAGVILLMLAGFAWLNAEKPRWRPATWFNAFFAASGILALPIFVGHEIIMALKRLGDALGLPGALTLPLLLGLFFLGCVIAYRRVLRMFLG